MSTESGGSRRVHRFRVDATLPAMRDLGRIFGEFAGADPRLDPKSEALEELRLVVREAATNIVEHGKVPSPEGGLGVELSCDGEELVVRLESAGIPFDPRHAPLEPPDPEELAEGGYGIYLIRTLTDGIEYYTHEGGNVLVLRKRIGSSSRKAS
ncbi:MAG: ATP-binding protein [Candidatus Eisenbacteria bacterium]|uniref:ATP-binding protein n=1 Tax=Eiseniibacteriota bacterium TaxID=2212470 RepID=A0A956RPI5_UNCEI|nr:ATP-binding protein [Candidatus Eisenbacteria bacterium]